MKKVLSLDFESIGYFLPLLFLGKEEENMAGKITKGDIGILSFIAEYKFLTVKQLAALTKRTTQVVKMLAAA